MFQIISCLMWFESEEYNKHVGKIIDRLAKRRITNGPFSKRWPLIGENKESWDSSNDNPNNYTTVIKVSSIDKEHLVQLFNAGMT